MHGSKPHQRRTNDLLSKLRLAFATTAMSCVMVVGVAQHGMAQGSERPSAYDRTGYPAAETPTSSDRIDNGQRPTRAAEPYVDQASFDRPVSDRGVNQQAPSFEKNQPATNVVRQPAREVSTEHRNANAPAIPARSEASKAAEQDKAAILQGKKSNSIAGLIGSLGIVVGLFLLFVWFLRKASPKQASNLPPDVVQILGRSPLAPRQHLHLLRIGSKLLLVHVGAGGAETLTEITDPLEVDRLAGLCQQSRPNSATASFREVISQFSKTTRRGAKEVDQRRHVESDMRGGADV